MIFLPHFLYYTVPTFYLFGLLIMHNAAQHNYVISLTTEQKRRKHITEEFGKQNIPFEFFDAITPDIIEETAKKFNITFDRSSKATLCDAEIACALSHIVLWNFVLENNLDYINIFEDDIYLGENAKELLNIDYIPEDTDILKLEAHGKIIYGKREQIKCNRNISQLKFKHTGTAGYSITAKGAKYLLDKVKNKQIYIAIDSFMFDELLRKKDYKVMQLSPAICAQSFILHDENYFESGLHNGREKVHKNQIPAKPLAKIKNELIRIKKRIFGKQVPFK
ncbi:glycosyltransferase family 25 protein [Haemophilus influenzae]|uniref:glycosyltransferase family 25 protein n=1 Tax=Haemophilus influenzae TaxID=727 RepID=UPI000681BEEC|nr:glycosyltransferase family 25 protein [Haemophilus influenzae]KMZ15141.1 lipooligosaccharide biosynthesis protein lpsA [Haemophilus influenzae]KMZ17709.1 lipooligosaccharide biosynthesis protein lpsA [Haemophilus influenzae]